MKKSVLNNDLFTKALEASNSSITIVDMRESDQPLIYVNPAFERMTGYSAKEVIGRNCRFLHQTEKKQAGLKILRDRIKKKEAVSVLIQNFRKNGDVFWNELHISPIFEKSQVTHYIGVQTDVSERVKAQQELERYQLHLESLIEDRTQELNEKNVALKELLNQVELDRKRMEDQIITNVDHLLLPLIKRMQGSPSEIQKQYLEIIEKNLLELVSPIAKELSRKLYGLSPREIEICNLIRQGIGTKEMAGFFNVSQSTIENQRNTIRKKLGISTQKVNLITFLQNLK